MAPAKSRRIQTTVSRSLYEAIEKRCAETGESISHIVQTALAQLFELEHHTLYQVSTSTALVQGIYQGCVSVERIKEHGDFGLGTFDELNGEGFQLDGKVWQALSDGSVNEVSDNTLVPFWASTFFQADRIVEIGPINDWDSMCKELDALRKSENTFTAIRIDGIFDHIHYRVACRSKPGTNLVAATDHQAEFNVTNCEGTLMGFWSPEYVTTLNVPGYHLHLLSRDHLHGGHVLALSAKKLNVQVMDANDLVMALPETPQFLAADLSIDPTKALSEAEGAKR